MDDDFEKMVVSVRADTGGFARDVEAMRAQLDGPLTAGAERAGRAIEGALARAIRTGSFGFEDLKRVALAALTEIAQAALGVQGAGGGGGLVAGLTNILGSFLGAPGRATGGGVSPGRAYMVGERGPELFVPTAAGRVETGTVGRAVRDVRVTINVQSPQTGAPEALTRSSRQIARAVRAALNE